jgi:hypothetical protein
VGNAIHSGPDAKYHQRNLAGRHLLLLAGEVFGPMAAVFVRRLAVEQQRPRRRIDRAVAAVHELGEFGARAVAADADLVPAIHQFGGAAPQRLRVGYNQSARLAAFRG